MLIILLACQLKQFIPYKDPEDIYDTDFLAEGHVSKQELRVSLTIDTEVRCQAMDVQVVCGLSFYHYSIVSVAVSEVSRVKASFIGRCRRL